MSEELNLIILREMRDYWEPVKVEVLSDEDRDIYKKRKSAVDLYIDGYSLKLIEEKTGISSSETIRYVRRCIKESADGKVIGYAALLKNRTIQPKKSKLEKLFMEHVGLREFVEGNYFGDKKYTLEKNMNMVTLHQKFLKECLSRGIQDYEFPFDSKDKGYKTLCNYIKTVKNRKVEKAIHRESKDAVQKFKSTGIGPTYTEKPVIPFQTVQIDGHRIDMLYSVEVIDKGGLVHYMPATRLWLLAVIDVATRVILGYSLSTYENYNQTDVLKALQNSIIPHKHQEFSLHYFNYPENGGFPSERISETKWARFHTIMLDNAKAHLAENVVTKLTEDLKCAVNFGSVATPETRGIVERFFKTLETGGFHRLPGTTGSNPRDVKRRNPEKEVGKYRITFEDIEELTEYFIAEYNNSAHEGLSNQTPLEAMENRIKNAMMTPSVLSSRERSDVYKLTNFLEERTIRGGYKSGTRPYLNYMGVRYQALDVPLDMGFVGQKVYVDINPEDLRTVDIYSLDGKKLCLLKASGEWGRIPHSLKTRELYNQWKNKNKEMNPSFSPDLEAFEKELSARAQKSRRARTQADTVKENLSWQPKKMDKEPEKPKKMESNTSRNEGYTDEQLKEIAAIGIFKAYERGIL